jgi:hypothetical protein
MSHFSCRMSHFECRPSRYPMAWVSETATASLGAIPVSRCTLPAAGSATPRSPSPSRASRFTRDVSATATRTRPAAASAVRRLARPPRATTQGGHQRTDSGHIVTNCNRTLRRRRCQQWRRRWRGGWHFRHRPRHGTPGVPDFPGELIGNGPHHDLQRIRRRTHEPERPEPGQRGRIDGSLATTRTHTSVRASRTTTARRSTRASIAARRSRRTRSGRSRPRSPGGRPNSSGLRTSWGVLPPVIAPTSYSPMST